jgi:hypothetical protein
MALLADRRRMWSAQEGRASGGGRRVGAERFGWWRAASDLSFGRRLEAKRWGASNPRRVGPSGEAGVQGAGTPSCRWGPGESDFSHGRGSGRDSPDAYPTGTRLVMGCRGARRRPDWRSNGQTLGVGDATGARSGPLAEMAVLHRTSCESRMPPGHIQRVVPLLLVPRVARVALFMIA